MSTSLPEHSYSDLLSMTDNVSTAFLRQQPFTDKVDLLTAAMLHKYLAAAKALLACKAFVPPKTQSHVTQAVAFGGADIVETLLESGRFDVNKSVNGYTPIRLELRKTDADLRILSLLLSRDDILLGPGSALDALEPLCQEKYKITLRHPRANINAQYSVRDGPSDWTTSTPLTSAIYLALRSGLVENFDTVSASERVRFDQKVCFGKTTVTPEEFAVLMAPALGRTVSDPLLQYMLDKMEANTNRGMWDMCKIC